MYYLAITIVKLGGKLVILYGYSERFLNFRNTCVFSVFLKFKMLFGSHHSQIYILKKIMNLYFIHCMS